MFVLCCDELGLVFGNEIRRIRRLVLHARDSEIHLSKASAQEGGLIHIYFQDLVIIGVQVGYSP